MNCSPCSTPLTHTQVVLPVYTRLLYCCGLRLRPQEPPAIRTRDVDLETGDVYIRQSKKHKDRHIIMSGIITTGATFTAIGVRPLAAGVKTATEGADLRPLWPSITAAPALPWHSPKNKQGIPATPNVPDPPCFQRFSRYSVHALCIK